MNHFGYENYDGLGIAELIKQKEVSKPEVLEAALNKMESVNKDVNAFIYTRKEKVQKEILDENEGIFAGVPFALKDISQEMKGEPLTLGSKVHKDYVSNEDSEYVKRLRKQGLLFLGYTNVPEFGLMAVTEPKHYGPTRNPWNLDYTPGGSSGGSAAAVASGMVPFAGANDGGGSIRIPAAYCGLFGLKPTRGRTPVGPKNGRYWQGATVEHAITKTVRDSAALLDILNGVEKAGAYTAPPFNGRYLKEIEKGIETPLKIAFSIESPILTEVNKECQAAVIKTVKHLESLGHHVIEKNAPVDGKKLAASYITLYFGEVSASISRLEEVIGKRVKYEDVEPTTWLLSLLGKATTAQEFVLSLQEWDRAAYEMEVFHETYDLYITPTTAFPPAKIGDHDLKSLEKLALEVTGKIGSAKLLKKLGIVDKLVEDSLKRVPFTQLANLTGQPAMSVPLHVTNEGLPVGVQFMAARGKEDLLLKMAAMLEQTSLWTPLNENPYFKID
ncbi:amidase [Sutcliffiella cohnii]|uniref:amidase n=1 Tax=Sutcliffiella cohnii TaxID=33932 RepID=UPI002E1C2E27|nr:amidase family protein [Sutcliffiella cohnii]